MECVMNWREEQCGYNEHDATEKYQFILEGYQA